MKVHSNPADKTNFLQSLMHMIKGNLGTGILAMPASFSHCGLVSACIGLPVLCLIAAYCVHLLVRASQHLENKMKWTQLEYAELAKGSFKTGPSWIRPYSGAMCKLVDGILVICQMGICCVYLVFIVDNVTSVSACV
jgi:proton-coupled amino acid transporter